MIFPNIIPRQLPDEDFVKHCCGHVSEDIWNSKKTQLLSLCLWCINRHFLLHLALEYTTDKKR